MASAAVLNVPYLGAWLKLCGCFPKMKFTKDRNSMRLLQENYEAGYPILLFPEGNRSWDGRIGPVSKGIGRLIKRLGCKVVYVRLPTASLFQPRWATYPRWVPTKYSTTVLMNTATNGLWMISGKTLYKRSQLTQKLLEILERLVFVLYGLPNYLWPCPNCFTLDSSRSLSRIVTVWSVRTALHHGK